ncbi:ADRL-like protein [Mya arenaria]|uniref:ADRL-like protein n=1 Tax=Mya arenaria TaxID=6604 RepID=A0ABY7FS26_MYAAR|nr:adiponectin receptor protein 1-like [Mya arenaria]WAR24967.1 ADRL-like protein [Mya arenaria]
MEESPVLRNRTSGYTCVGTSKRDQTDRQREDASRTSFTDSSMDAMGLEPSNSDINGPRDAGQDSGVEATSSDSSSAESTGVKPSRKRRVVRDRLMRERSLSECRKRSTKQKHRERSNSEPSVPALGGGLADFLEGSKRVVAGAEDFMMNVLQASWRIVHHHKLPEWLQDNEYLVFGHRLPLNSFRACFKSVFRIHTETGNIWTHLLGMLAFICIATYTLSSRYIDWMWQDITVHSVFFGGAIICLTFSWLFHTVFCHSESVNKLFSKLDYCGIALLTVGSFVPWLYYGFYRYPVAHIVYLVSIIGLGTGCIVVSLFDKFAAPEYRPVRAGLFIALGLTGVIPGFHFVVIEGFQCAVYEFGFLHLILMAILYIGGALMYAFRVPESIYPGRFDIWFQSHQIFHICVILAALVHFRGIQIISHARLTSVRCSLHA